MLQCMYGMKKYKVLTKEEIASAAARYKIPSDALYELDTAYAGYMAKFRQEYTSFTVENHLHPLQVTYYDKRGAQVSFHSGVYADAGLFNLRWNFKRQFDYFPPVTEAPIDSIMNFETHLRFVRTLNGNSPDPAVYRHASYNVIVHWARFTGRQSRRLIRVVQKNAKRARQQPVNYFFVNTDNLYQNSKPDY